MARRRGLDEAGLPERLGAAAIVRLRFLWPLAAIAAAAAAYVYLPSFSSLPTAQLDVLIPETAALDVEERSAELFGVPLLPRIAVAQRDPEGLTREQQEAIVTQAVAASRGELEGFPEGTIAVPLINVEGLVPASEETETTAITYLGFPLEVDPVEQLRLATEYSQRLSDTGPTAHVTGSLAGQLVQSETVNDHLIWVELGSLAVVGTILGFYFFSVAVPLVTLLTAAIAYVIAERVVAWIGIEIDSAVPAEVAPLIVVLLLGVVTDYSVFFLAGMRARLTEGESRLAAAKATTAQFLPIIVTAGVLVAGGVASLAVAEIEFFNALGPGMAFTIIVGLLVTVTVVPSLMALLGRWMFWPGMRRSGTTRAPVTERPVEQRTWRRKVAEFATRRWVAAILALVVVAGLAAAATGLFETRLSVTSIRSLTSSTEPVQGAAAAGQGFARGIFAPTEVVVEAQAPFREEQLQQISGAIEGVDGVAAVVGPTDIPRLEEIAGVDAESVFRNRSEHAARFLVVLDRHPFSSAATDVVERIDERLPPLLDELGLADASVGLAGETAITEETIDLIHRDIAWVTLTALLVNLVLLAVFLRSLVAPFYLVAVSALALAATLGATTYFFVDFLGHESLTYYVPLAVGVLLVSFGSDYNLFIVGRIWQEAGRRPLREAVIVATPRASRAITVAGVALALSFATLALVPLTPFREFAFAIGVGVLLDTFVVRSALIPTLISAVGRFSWWPGRRGQERPAPEADASVSPSAGTTRSPAAGGRSSE